MGFYAFVLENSGRLDAYDTSGEKDDIDEMDPELWSHIGSKYLDPMRAVLLRLPAASQARFRAVSHAWLDMLSSWKFQKQSAALAFESGLPCFLMHYRRASWSQSQRKFLAGPNQKVHELPLEYLPARFRNVSDKVVSQGGLIVIPHLKESGKDHQICVVNPRNKIWRELPLLAIECTNSVHMAVSGTPDLKNWRVFAVDVDHFHVYDSTAEFWSSSPRSPAGPEWLKEPLAVFCAPGGETLYCVLQGAGMKEPIRIEVWTMDGRYLHTLPVPEGTEDCKIGRIAFGMMEGKPILVTDDGAENSGYAENVDVWKLTGSVWTHVSSMEESAADLLTVQRHVFHEVLEVAGDWIFLKTSHWGSANRSSIDIHTDCFHVGSNRWHDIRSGKQHDNDIGLGPAAPTLAPIPSDRQDVSADIDDDIDLGLPSGPAHSGRDDVSALIPAQKSARPS